MAEALLTRRLTAAGAIASVRSAGIRAAAGLPSQAVVTAMAGYGLDVAGHPSQALCHEDLQTSALVIAMAREHLRHAVVTEPAAWPRAFTLKELVRRGDQLGPRTAGEPLADWLGRAHSGRERSALLGDWAGDEIADPSGGSPQDYAAAAAELDLLVTRLVELAWGHALKAGPATSAD
jgi:protein-tyrosine-phosphatase